MRELAVQKLSQAYRLDEIAASVATMQGASALDHLADFVLARNATNIDANYVHFFHEKIPSRMMSESTPLEPLNNIIAAQPGHSAPYRTRALTKIFKDDHAGAIQDLTEAVTLCRMEAAKHRAGRDQLVTMQTVREEAEKRKTWTRDWMQENRVLDEDQPRGMELQLLFQRGNQYLTLACQSILPSLSSLKKASNMPDSQSSDDYQSGVQNRETIRKYAKRALRDYMTFFSKLDYAHAPRHSANDEIFGRDPIVDDLEEFDAPPARLNKKENNPPTSTALTRSSNAENQHRHRHNSSPPPPLKIHEMSTLLSTSPPADLPPYPISGPEEDYDDETLTYHPLLPETLHSFLLTHCLLQTDATTLLRHAHNVARLVRLADGYPFFLAARSPARADWAEILRKTHNWIDLPYTWEQLCKISPPSPFSKPGTDVVKANGRPKTGPKEPESTPSKSLTKSTSEASSPRLANGESTDQKRDRIHKEAVMDALGDERVVDDETFHRSVRAREKRAWRDSIEESTKTQLNGMPNGEKAPPEQIENLETDSKAGKAELPPPPNDPPTLSSQAPITNGTNLPTKPPPAPAGQTNVSMTNGSTMNAPPPPAQPTTKPPPNLDVAKLDTTAPSPKVNDKSSPASAPPSRHIPFRHNKPIAKDEEYLIGTERAEAIARWIAEAPSSVDVGVVPGVGRRKKKGKGRKKPARDGTEGANGNGVGERVRGNGTAAGAAEGEGEEVDD